MKSIANLAQMIGISVGISMLVTFSEDFWLRTIGFIVLIVSLDWRYIYDRNT